MATSTRVPFQVHTFAFILSLFAVLSHMFTIITSAQLSANSNSSTCDPFSIINQGVKAALQSEARMGASLLRLHFHDCFVNGCDGSILLDDAPGFTGEKSAAPNSGSVRGYEVIDSIKAQLEQACGPQSVSCADIVAVAARDSVVVLGGPSWDVRLGRKDSTTASFSKANSEIPAPTSSLDQLITAFSKKGFNPRELVALSGGHTIGQARCTFFRNRIYNDGNIDPAFAKSLQAICPMSGGDNNLAQLDNTPTSFDNAYFKNLQGQRGLLHSDQELYNRGSVDPIVNTYSSNPSVFTSDFANAMVKMSTLGPPPGSIGEVRKNCRRIN